VSNARLVIARARQLPGPGEAVPSPCLSVCRMETASAVCAGCFRTLDEIAGWSSLPESGKRAVWQRVEQRARSTLDSRSAAP
jgi:predicted Fe-S protein YdhL (DUF1289 family)